MWCDYLFAAAFMGLCRRHVLAFTSHIDTRGRSKEQNASVTLWQEQMECGLFLHFPIDSTTSCIKCNAIKWLRICLKGKYEPRSTVMKTMTFNYESGSTDQPNIYTVSTSFKLVTTLGLGYREWMLLNSSYHGIINSSFRRCPLKDLLDTVTKQKEG